jgi:hypothetical protein
MDSYEYRAKIKFVNQLYALSAAHASQVEQSIAAASTVVAKELHEEVGKNRTMHEFARVMHVVSDSGNLAGTSDFSLQLRLNLSSKYNLRTSQSTRVRSS